MKYRGNAKKLTDEKSLHSSHQPFEGSVSFVEYIRRILIGVVFVVVLLVALPLVVLFLVATSIKRVCCWLTAKDQDTDDSSLTEGEPWRTSGNVFNTSKSVTGTSLRIISCNCCLWPWAVRQSLKDRNKKRRAEEILTLFEESKTDVMFLQEAFGSGWCSYFPRFFDSKQHIAAIFAKDTGSLCCLPLLDSGLVVLTKHKVLSSHFTHYDASNEWIHKLRPGGFQTVKLCLQHEDERNVNNHIYVFNTHLYPDEGDIGWRQLSPPLIRKLQYEQLCEAISQLPPGSRWILGGDFNVDATSAEARDLFESLRGGASAGSVLSKSARGEVNRFAPMQPTVHMEVPFAVHEPHLRYQSVDHIYSSMYISSGKVRTDQVTVSDHYPVEAVLETCVVRK